MSALMISAGYHHSCAITNKGSLLCWGQNASGQLGNGAKDLARVTPELVRGFTADVTAVSAGGSHTCALVDDMVQCWGSNDEGRLGVGDSLERLSPTPVSGLKGKISAVSAGGSHTCALLDGTVQCWGANDQGQLGDGSTTSRLIPTAVKGLPRSIVAVSAGGAHSCALSNLGAITCWGANDQGQLGNGSTQRSLVPLPVQSLNNVTSVQTGGGHTCVILSEGSLRCWGRNWAGQLGDGTTDDRFLPTTPLGMTSGVRAVATSLDQHTCAVLSSGTVRCWGMNEFGQLGDGTSSALDPQVVVRLTPVDVLGTDRGTVQVVTGAAHSCSRSESGLVQCWGLNRYGALGDSTTTDRRTPVSITTGSTQNILYDFENGDTQTWIGQNIKSGPWSVDEWSAHGSSSLKADISLGSKRVILHDNSAVSGLNRRNLNGKLVLSASVRHASWGEMGRGMTAKLYLKVGGSWRWFDGGQVPVSDSATTLTLKLSDIPELEAVREIGVEFITPQDSSGISAVYVDRLTVE